MTKRVAVIASGETERRALPYLVSHLKVDGIDVAVNIPPRNQRLTVAMAESLIKSLLYGSQPPDKVVVLIDVDGKDPGQVLNPFKAELPKRLPYDRIKNLQFAYAQWHLEGWYLEAWYFGDVDGLRGYLGGQAPGSVDTSQPDHIENPKNHLKNLLGDRRYTALVSEEIAQKLNPQTIAQRSPSFRGFIEAVQNGASASPGA